ncbi:TetR/AcrR family transcriptional regulator [Actinoallomurus sp. NBC_01490]|uniref:TetR/AcrR family transcriptional regulator n=1 Tax=Actinoallomurus sp. NBC_01490 TaxID=2903557 RepID=UPI002E3183B6|nr:TetR/AcrR family transcriptional regulator [Actinoallomurus sp. NBC_01490]
MTRRPHTGRRRNEAAREAIWDAILELAGQGDPAALSIEAIAAASGVGKQTIYRWWPSKGALLLEMMVERARLEVPAVDTGTLVGDLREFLTATFRAVSDEANSSVLRSVMAEAQKDAHLAEVLREFTAGRRRSLHEIFQRGQKRGEPAPDADLDLLVDQAYGLLWYRIMIGHAPLTPAVAGRLAEHLAGGP